MRKREVGQTGLSVSVIGLGCSRFGSVGSGVSDRQAVALISHAWEIGITLFDTASIYGQGDSERLLGEALRGKRDQVVLISKAGYELSAVGGLIARHGKPLVRRLAARSGLVRKSTARARSTLTRHNFDPNSVRRSLDASLGRLKSDYVDIYLLHSLPAEEMACSSVFEVLETAKHRGQVRHYGFSLTHLTPGLAPLLPVGVEVIGGPVNPSEEAGIVLLGELPARVGVVGYQPFAGRSGGPGNVRLPTTHGRAADVARELGLSPAQVMIRFALQQPAVSAVVVGTSSLEHLSEDAAGLDGPIDSSPIVW